MQGFQAGCGAKLGPGQESFLPAKELHDDRAHPVLLILPEVRYGLVLGEVADMSLRLGEVGDMLIPECPLSSTMALGDQGEKEIYN